MVDLPFPTAPSTPLTDQFKTWSNTEHQADLLKFHLSIPRAMQLFKSDNAAPRPDFPIRDLAYFRDDLKKPKLEILVQASVIQQEVSLKDYYTRWTQVRGADILQQRCVENDPDSPDILLAQNFPDGETWISRRTGYKTWMQHGAFVVTLDVGCPLEAYKQNADMICEVVDSLRPNSPPKYALAEDLKLWSKRYPFDFTSYLPASWKELHHHNDTPEQMHLAFTREFKGVPAGLSIRAVSREKQPDKTELLRECVAPWTTQGLDATQFTFAQGPSLGELKTTEAAANFTYRAEEQEIQYEYRMLFAEPKDCWLQVELISLAKEQDFEAWSVNNRALEIFVSRFKHL